MQTKLTVRLDDRLIRQAKAFARRRGTSVSKMIAGYFELLDVRHEEPTDSLPPTVRSLKGCMRGASVDREDYHRHLEEKYL